MKKFVIFFVFIFNVIFSIAQTPVFEWARGMGGGTKISAGNGKSIAIDVAGNVYTIGAFQGTVDFDPGSGFFNLSSIGSDDLFVSKIDASGNFVWAKSIGGTGYDYGASIDLDLMGNIYLTGSFEGTVDFDPDLGTSYLNANGLADIFIAKFDALGNFIWVKGIGGIGSDAGSSIALDAAGNIYTTGSFQDTVDFDPGVGIHQLVVNGSVDMFVSKLDSSGNFIWAKNSGGSLAVIQGYSIALDSMENVYTGGYFSGTVDFDPDSAVFQLTANVGNNDAFISKIDSSGNFIWAKRIGGASVDQANAITVSESGNVFTTGYFADTADFDPGAGVYNLISDSLGTFDVFILKLDPLGNFIWAKKMGGPLYEVASSIAVDASENVYSTGFYQGTSDFDPGPGFYNLTAIAFDDTFISKLDSSGNFVWAVEFGGEGASINLDDAANIYTSGNFRGTFDFDPGAGVYNIPPHFSGDVFIHKMSQSSTVGTDEIAQQTNISIFPNPTTSSFNINISAPTKKTLIEIYNSLGALVYNETTSTAQTTIDISNQSSGIYFVKVMSDNKIIGTQKIIKE